MIYFSTSTKLGESQGADKKECSNESYDITVSVTIKHPCSEN